MRRRSLRFIARSILAVTCSFCLSNLAKADQPFGYENNPIAYSAPDKAASALGHYARARTLLIGALQEFDKGRRIAQPDPLVNSVDWRETIILRAKELELLIDPRARSTNGGVKYEGDRRLLTEPKESSR
jgi:hypothetical protein